MNWLGKKKSKRTGAPPKAPSAASASRKGQAASVPPPPLPDKAAPRSRPDDTPRYTLEDPEPTPPLPQAQARDDREDAPETQLTRAADALEQKAKAFRSGATPGGKAANTDNAERINALQDFLSAVRKSATDTSNDTGTEPPLTGQVETSEDPAAPTNVTPLEGASGAPGPEETSDGPKLVAANEGLTIHSLGKQFKKRPVLRDVSLRVQRGEAVGLLGPNGAGKTTCFYMISGLIAADQGQIVLDGTDITDLPMYRRARLGIGYLPQEASIFRGMTVEQNIRAVLEGVENQRDKREAMLEALMAEFSISHLRRSPSVALSGGERRRLEIARALASQPHFILLDEPLAGIDPIAVRDIRELVSHLKDRGIGVLITDHNVRETLDLVDRAYILHDGRVLMEGTPDEIVRNQEVRRVYLGDRFNL